jgi:hypothetical protein
VPRTALSTCSAFSLWLRVIRKGSWHTPGRSVDTLDRSCPLHNTVATQRQQQAECARCRQRAEEITCSDTHAGSHSRSVSGWRREAQWRPDQGRKGGREHATKREVIEGINHAHHTEAALPKEQRSSLGPGHPTRARHVAIGRSQLVARTRRTHFLVCTSRMHITGTPRDHCFSKSTRSPPEEKRTCYTGHKSTCWNSHSRRIPSSLQDGSTPRRRGAHVPATHMERKRSTKKLLDRHTS